jgi:signal transduction histidine kinase
MAGEQTGGQIAGVFQLLRMPRKVTRRRTIPIVLAIFLTTATVAVMLSPAEAGWQRFRTNFLYGLAYANGVGWLAWLLGPHLGASTAKMGTWLRWTVVVVSFVLIGIVGSIAALTALAGFGMFPWSEYFARFRSGFQISMAVTLVVGIGFFLYESTRYRLQYETMRARFAALETRLRPHFLFNTLNSISALISEDPKAAERMTEQLAALLRFSLDATDRDTVRLDHELQVATDFLDIEKTRFGERLRYTVDVPPDLFEAQVPPFSLQTLVENSVRHGGKEIRVTARNGDRQMILSVWDSGPGFSTDVITPGHGLHNLRSRLVALWGNRARLDVIREESGTRVTLTFPGTASRDG